MSDRRPERDTRESVITSRRSRFVNLPERGYDWRTTVSPRTAPVCKQDLKDPISQGGAAHGTDGRSNVSRYTALNNPVLQTEGRVTLIDGLLAAAVLVGLVFNAALGWWRADPAAGYVLVYYAVREVWEILSDEH
jgi:hypothetical protein